MFNKWLLYIISYAILTSSSSFAAQSVPTPGPSVTCPICNMFVARYPGWIAAISYKDGTTDYFDGAKHLFKYLLDMEKWAPGRTTDTITTITVESYPGADQIDGRIAFYIFGSDVLGPMGHELVPFSSEKEAQKFMQEHKGKGMKRFDDVDQKFLMNLHKGIFNSE